MDSAGVFQQLADVSRRRFISRGITAAGWGTRFLPITKSQPKEMLPLIDKPLIHYVVEEAINAGIEQIVLITAISKRAIEDYFEDGARWSMDIRYSRDPTPLGTGGAVRNALDLVASDPFLAMNGDSYCPVDIGLLHETHVARNATATIWAVHAGNGGRYGSLVVDPDGAVRAFQEKSTTGRGLVNAGVYVLERRAEMAVMRAAGFSRPRLARMVLLENVYLLAAGLATGVFAALVAVLPHKLAGGANTPLGLLAWELVGVFVVGLLAGWAAVRSTARAPVVAALRGD